MKPGLFQGSIAASVPMERCIELVKELGFEGLEITAEDAEPLLPEAIEALTDEVMQIGQSVGMTIERPGAVTLQSTREHVTGVSNMARQSGVRIHSVASMMHFFYPLSSPVKKVRERAIELALKMIEIAEVAGAETVLLVPGMVTPGAGYGDVYRRSQAVIRDLATEAERRDVVLAVENVWNYFLLSPLEMAQYLDEIGSDHVGAYFDVANVLSYGFPGDWLHILGPRVRGVHFKDFRKDIRNLQAFVHLLHGDVAWDRVAQALRDIEYGGYVTVEVPPLRHHALKALRDARSSLDVIFS